MYVKLKPGGWYTEENKRKRVMFILGWNIFFKKNNPTNSKVHSQRNVRGLFFFNEPNFY